VGRVRVWRLDDERVVVQPGVANLDVTRAVADHAYFYAPDPSSQQVCSIGGNVAENSGGAHCLKYGFTAHHVTGLEVVMPDGTVERFGGGAPGAFPRLYPDRNPGNDFSDNVFGCRRAAATRSLSL